MKYKKSINLHITRIYRNVLHRKEEQSKVSARNDEIYTGLLHDNFSFNQWYFNLLK